MVRLGKEFIFIWLCWVEYCPAKFGAVQFGNARNLYYEKKIKRIEKEMEKRKTIIHYTNSIKEAVDSMHDFLECDLYTKFRPEQKIPSGKKGKIETWYRKDMFKNEKEFIEYLDAHFEILKKEIIRIIGKQKYKELRKK